jgi:hypothetical protein
VSFLLTIALLLISPLPPIEAPPFAEATLPAVRLDPPAPPATESPVGGSSDSVDGRCVGWLPVISYYSPGWDSDRMAQLAYRESRCQPGVRNPSGSTGLLQLMPMHCVWLRSVLGHCSVADLENPYYNIAAAAQLWIRDGYAPWKL